MCVCASEAYTHAHTGNSWEIGSQPHHSGQTSVRTVLCKMIMKRHTLCLLNPLLLRLHHWLPELSDSIVMAPPFCQFGTHSSEEIQ